ncbi:hypothetical protein FB451DRAFT_1482873 [Mycena latifolia]|nr:hypothetical protein FB451DRAFT_1482873 [Mycena latifolia]
MSAPLAPTIDASSFNMASDSTEAQPRPAKAPPLTSMPSSPGLEVPGGYPRNSVVFAGNKWDHGDRQAPLLAAAKTYLPAVPPPIAKAKAYLPPAVASYFPSTEATPTSDGNGNLSVPAPYPMNTDGSAASDFSTRAYVGSGSSRGTLTPVPSDFHSGSMQGAPSTPGEHSHSPSGSSEALQRPVSDASTGATSAPPPSPPAEEHRRTQLIDPGVVPLPSVAPFVSALVPTHPTVATSPSAHAASPSASSSSGSASTSSPSTASTMTTPPSSPASAKSPSGFARWASLRRAPGSKAASPPSKGSAPPSAFAKSAHRASADSPSSPPSAFAKSATGRASLDAPPTYQFTPMAQSEAEAPPKRRASLLRTLRGEAKVLSGKMRRDPARVEAGRRMMGGA